MKVILCRTLSLPGSSARNASHAVVALEARSALCSIRGRHRRIGTVCGSGVGVAGCVLPDQICSSTARETASSEAGIFKMVGVIWWLCLSQMARNLALVLEKKTAASMVLDENMAMSSSFESERRHAMLGIQWTVEYSGAGKRIKKRKHTHRG